MALSNIRAEPRREWTEQAIGFGLLLVLLFVELKLAFFLEALCGVNERGERNFVWEGWFPLLIVSTVIGFFALLGFWYLSHFVGEKVCAMLKAGGIDPRPKQRYDSNGHPQETPEQKYIRYKKMSEFRNS